MAEELTKENFARQLHTNFRARYAPGQALELELIEVTDPDENKETKPKMQKRFSLLFRGPKESLLWHGIYKFEHELMGEFDLYIAPVYVGPVDQSDEWLYYEAVFNLLTQ